MKEGKICEITLWHEWEEHIDINPYGSFSDDKAVSSIILRASCGSIVNIGSIEGFGKTTRVIQRMERRKRGLHGLTRAIAVADYGAIWRAM